MLRSPDDGAHIEAPQAQSDGVGANRWPDRLSTPRGIQPLAHEAPALARQGRPTYPTAWPATRPANGDDA